MRSRLTTALEGIAFNRTRATMFCPLGHSLHLSNLFLLLLIGLVVTMKPVVSMSLVLDGFLRQRYDVGCLLFLVLGVSSILRRGARREPSAQPRHCRTLPKDLPRPAVDSAEE